MKKVIDFVKANLLSVLSVAVAVVALPLLVFFSMGQASKLHDEVQGDLDGMNRTLKQVDFDYVFEPVKPGDEVVEFSRAPNEKTNAAMRSWGDQLREQASSAIRLIVDRNSEGKRVLLEGLFPDPSESDRVGKLQEVVAIWPMAHKALLTRAKAGSPPDREMLEVMLNGHWRQEIERVQSKLDQVPEEEYERIRAKLTETRLAAYRDTAANLRFYVDDSAFSNVQAWGQNTLPPMSVVWDWQWRRWIHGDLIRALRLANTSEDGWERSLLEGPVKRLERVEVTPWSFVGESQQLPIDYSVEVPLNWNASLTGFASWPGAQQGLYDVRYATVVALVDSARLGAVIDAINATNLMTVVEVSTEDMDPSKDMAMGYVYGQGQIVRATFTIETVWLRSWMKRYMPAEVRKAMGVPPDPEPEAEFSTDGSETDS